MYARCWRIGGGADAHTATPTAAAAVVVVIVAAAAVVRIVVVVVGAGCIGATRIAQPGIRTGRKVGISLIGTRIVAQIGDVVATVQAMMRLAGMQTGTHRLIWKVENTLENSALGSI